MMLAYAAIDTGYFSYEDVFVAGLTCETQAADSEILANEAELDAGLL